MSPEMQASLKKIQDHQDIVDVVNRFMAAQDARDWVALTATMSANPRIESTRFGLQQGIDEVLAGCKRSLGRYDGILHVANNVRVEQTGDTAKVHYYAISHLLRRGAEGGDYVTNRGVNTIDVVRTKDGWRIECYRSSKILWQEGNPQVRVNKADPATHGG